MNKTFRLTLAFFRLVRLPNLVIIIFTLYMIRHAILRPLLGTYGLHLQLGFYNFMLLTLSVVFISAAGYVINDYFDRKTDFMNKPGKVIIGRYIDRRFAMFLHIVFNLFAFIFGAYISFQLQLPQLSLVFLMVIGTLWFYSTTYKRQFLLGNFIVSLFAGIVPLMVLLFEIPALKLHYGSLLPLAHVDLNIFLAWIGGFSIFAFIMTLARELIKDVEDHHGDQSTGRNTMPVVWGIENTRIVIITILFIIALAVIFINIIYLSHIISLLYTLITIIFPLAYTSYSIWLARDKNGFRKASVWLKIVMISGICYAFIANHFIIN